MEISILDKFPVRIYNINTNTENNEELKDYYNPILDENIQGQNFKYRISRYICMWWLLEKADNYIKKLH